MQAGACDASLCLLQSPLKSRMIFNLQKCAKNKESVDKPRSRVDGLFVCLLNFKHLQNVSKGKTCKNLSLCMKRPGRGDSNYNLSCPTMQPYALHHPFANQVTVLITSPWILCLLPPGPCAALCTGCSLSFHSSITPRN